MAVRFDASTDAYRATTGLPTGTAYSVTCWVNLTTDRNAFTGVWGLDDGGTTRGVYLQTLADGTTLVAGDFAGSTVGSVALTVDTWYQVGVTVSGTSVALYTAAAGAALAAATGTLALTPNTAPTRLAVGDEGFGGFLNGRIAGLKVWGAQLSQAEVDNELSQYTPSRLTNLLRWHPFLTAETTDYSGNGTALTAGATGTATEDGPPIPWVDLSPIVVFTPSAGGGGSVGLIDSGVLDTSTLG